MIVAAIKLDDITLDENKEEPKEEDKKEETVENGKEDYSYEFLLRRIYDRITTSKPSTGNVKRTIEPPEVLKYGTKKVVWANFSANCRSINRPTDHVVDFVLNELGTEGSLNAENKLIIKGRFQSKNFENVLRKYISEYVTCKTCRNPNTELKKENRITYKVCKECGASSSVSSIKAGFRSQSRRNR